MSIVIAPPEVNRIFLESPGCSKIFDNTFINFEAVSRSRMFLFGYPPLLRQYYSNGGIELFTTLSDVQEMGVVTSLDFSRHDPETESGKVDWPEIMKKILPFIDIFVRSIEEALQIMLPEKYAEIQSSCVTGKLIDHILIDMIRSLGKQIIDFGVKILLIKMARRGAFLFTGDIATVNDKLDLNLLVKESYWKLLCNAHPVAGLKFKNDTATDDTAFAVFLAAILNGEGPESALKYSAIAGRNKLYCNSIYAELTDWQTMTEQITSESNKIIGFEA